MLFNKHLKLFHCIRFLIQSLDGKKIETVIAARDVILLIDFTKVTWLDYVINHVTRELNMCMPEHLTHFQ